MYTQGEQPQLQKAGGAPLGACPRNGCPWKQNLCRCPMIFGIRFLDLFQDNKNTGKDSLKFTKTFQMSVEHKDVSTVGTKEDYFPMGVILGAYGQTLNDFQSVDDALAAVRHLCGLNRDEHMYEEKPEKLDEKFPQFSRFWFVMSEGKKQEHKQEVMKHLEQHADIKNVAQLDEAKLFMEGMGFKSVEPGTDGVQVENAKACELKRNVELLKLSHLSLVIK